MKLLRLALHNFKGIKQFTLETNGDDVTVFGDNATGKTTLWDAFLWLLFDKDSANKKDFQIKRVDEQGNVEHGLNHEVEATLDTGEKQVTLRKVYAEQWQKKRGSAEQVFTGHTTAYYINGIPAKQNEYKDAIDDLVKGQAAVAGSGEEVFRLLTSPVYFNEVLHWQKRRELLLEVCGGDIGTAEVVAANKDVAALESVLAEHTIEDYRKKIKARRKDLNDELAQIPVRIDELTRSLPTADEAAVTAAEKESAQLETELQELHTQRAAALQGGGLADKKHRLRTVRADMVDLEHEAQARQTAQTASQRRELQAVQAAAYNLEADIAATKRAITDAEAEIESIDGKLATLRKQWQEVDAQDFVHKADDTCPTCGQDIPAAKVKAAREKAVAQYNADKAAKMAEIRADGKSLGERKKQLEADVAVHRDTIAAAETKLAGLQGQQKELNAQIEHAEVSLPDEHAALKVEAEQLEAEIANETQTTDTSKIDEQVASIKQKLAELQEVKGQVAQLERGKARIEELKTKERTLAAEFEKLERELFLTEEFVRTKVQLLEKQINARFGMADFKLFDVQVNGAVVECCETLFEGVPFGSLNNAARINVGLDIINTLADYYGVTAPIFIDNREAVTKLLSTKGQRISLVVSAGDAEMRVEKEKGVA